MHETSSSKPKRVVITYGTFDMFHIGHLNLLRRLSEISDQLIVGVSTDEFNAQKGKEAIIPYDERSAIVASIKGVDLVIPETRWDQKVGDIKNHGVTTFAMGDDWVGKFDDLLAHCEVLYLPRTIGISTTDLKFEIRRNRVSEQL
jgi:glycerol-3-phosphate cytidylyltransferase